MSKIATATLEIRVDGQSFAVDLNQIKAGIGSLGPTVRQAQQGMQGLSAEMKALGAGLSALGVGFSVSAVVGFGKAILDDADALVKLSDQTGVSIRWLQRFQVAGDDAGNTVDEITSAITKMEDKLVSGDRSAVAALGKLHLRLDDLLRLKPEEQFVAISDALRTIDDPARQVNIAIDLFGKSGAAILPTLKRGFDDVRDAMVGMSDEAARALDAAGDKWGEWWRQAKGYSAEAVVWLGEKLPQAWEMFTGTVYSHSLAQANQDLAELGVQLRKMGEGLARKTPFQPREIAPITLDDGQLREVMRDYDAEMDKRRAQHAAALEQQARQDKLTGADVRKALKQLSTDWAGLTAAQRANVEIVKRLMDVYEPLRKQLSPSELPANLEAVRNALLVVPPALRAIESGMGDIAEAARLLPFSNADIRQAERYAATLQRVLAIQSAPITGPVPGLPLLTPSSKLPFTFAQQLFSGIKGVFQNLPQVILAAVQGGGNVLKSVGTFIGTQIGANAASMLATSISKHFSTGIIGFDGKEIVSGMGKFLSNAFSSLLPLVGTLLGPLLSKIGSGFKRLFGGPSKDEKEAADVVKTFETSLEKAATAQEKSAAGHERWKITIQRVQQAYVAIGKTAEDANRDVSALWKAGNKKDAEAIAQRLQAAIDLQEQALEALPGLLEDVASGINKIASEPIVSQESFDRVGRLAVTAFNAAIAGGKSTGEAIADIGPALEQLVKAQHDLGFASSDTLERLLGFSRFAQENHEVLDALDGTRQMMAALRTMGLLTQQDFDDLNATAAAAFQKMTAEGVNADTALRAMQPTLQQIWQIQQDTGLAVDDTTQALIDQAEQQGLVGEHMKSTQEQTLDVLKAIARVLGADIPNALNGLPTKKTIEIEANRTGDGWTPPGFESGEGEGAPSREGFARGTPNLDFRNFGHRAFVTVHGDEAIIPRGRSHELADTIAARISEQLAGAGGSGPVDLRANLVLQDGTILTRLVVRDLQRNTNRARTMVAQALQPEFA